MTDHLVPPHLAIDENLRTAMRFFGEATEAGEVVALPGSVAIYCGINYGVFNISLLDGPLTGGADSFDYRMGQIAAYFKERTNNWSFWLCEDLLNRPEQRHADQLLHRLGLRAISHPPGMIATQILPPLKPLPAVELRAVTNVQTRQAFGDLTALCFEIPMGIAQRVYVPEQAWHGAYKGYVAYANGQPVSMVASVVTAGTLGIYSLGTHPNFRRKGYGEAAMRATIDAVTRAAKIERFVLQSTDAGHAIYRRMGFRDATRFTVYLTK